MTKDANSINYNLSHVDLKGFRSIKDLSAEFNPGLNIIIGKNGSGKTNLVNFLSDVINFSFGDYINIEAALKYQSSKADGFKVEIEKKLRIIASSKVNAIKENVAIKAPVFNLTTGSNEMIAGDEYVIRGSLADANIDIFSQIIRHGLPQSLPLLSNPITIEISGSFSELLTMTFNGGSLFQRNLLYRLYKEIENDQLFMTLLNGNLSGDNWEKPFKEMIKEIIHRAFDSEGLYESTFKAYSPIESIRLQEDFVLNYDHERKVIRIEQVYLQYYVNNGWYSYDALSDGTKRLIYQISEIMCDVLVLRKGEMRVLGYGSEPSRIIFLEEPELGIHPHQLQKLMSFLKEQSQDKQIIITTHSPQVLDILGADELDRIILCEYDKEKGTQLRHMTDEEKENARNYMKKMYLSDFWRYTDFNDK
ncbi:hypothetical protein BH11BAC7_BH11BAC7_08350 [soil metagenome]